MFFIFVFSCKNDLICKLFLPVLKHTSISNVFCQRKINFTTNKICDTYKSFVTEFA